MCNGRLMSELSCFAEACRVRCGRLWSEAHLDTPPSPSKDSPDTLSLVRAHVSSSCSGFVPCKQNTNTQKITTKWRDKNNLAYTNKRTCHSHSASPWPWRHILPLPPARLLQKEKKHFRLCRLSSWFIFLSFYIVSFSFFLSFFTFTSSSTSSWLLRVFPVADSSSRRKEWHAFEAGGIYRRRVNRWEIDCVSKCSINSLCLSHQSLSQCLPPPSRCKFPADFPLKHMLQLWVGCHLSL